MLSLISLSRCLTLLSRLAIRDSTTQAVSMHARERWILPSDPGIANDDGAGYITHRLRPTYYSPSSRTALAEAELKYQDGFKSRSVYIGFPVEQSDMSKGVKKAWQQACRETGERTLKLAIWTTTVWSLPGNMVSKQHLATKC